MVRSRGVVALLLASLVTIATGQEKKSSPPQTATYTPDIDLKSAPSYYRERVIRFRNILRKEPTREAKIAKAKALAKDRKSEYRRDAISFLGEVRATEVVPDLITLSKDREVREFVLYALGEIRDARAIPALIHYLGDSKEDIRGNAERALQQTTRMTFDYHYADPPAKRKQGIQEIQAWWKKNKATFKVREESADDKKAAEDAWEKYGRQYLFDLDR